jgi:predicted Fe-Mo cluster-binding NifX family protein
MGRVTIAIPIWQNRVSPVLDAATRLLLITRHRGREVGRKEIVLSPMPAVDLASNLAAFEVDVLLCAAVSEPLLRALEARGIRVERHVCGDLQEVLQAFCGRHLWRPEFRMPGCRGATWGGGCCRRRRARHGARTQPASSKTSAE